MTDSTKVTCPNCGHTGAVRISENKTGPANLTCPRCKHKFSHVVERRAFYRSHPLPLVRYGPFHFDFIDLSQKAELIDLSMEGMRIRVKKIPPEKRTRIGLSFLLPDAEEEIKAGAEVMWTQETTSGKYDVGLRFFHLDAFAKAKIGFFQRFS